MPIPTPQKGQSQDDFVEECMRFWDDEDSDLPRKQQLAACYDKYKRWKKNRKRRAKAKLKKSKNIVNELVKLKEYYDAHYKLGN